MGAQAAVKARRLDGAPLRLTVRGYYEYVRPEDREECEAWFDSVCVSPVGSDLAVSLDLLDEGKVRLLAVRDGREDPIVWVGGEAECFIYRAYYTPKQPPAPLLAALFAEAQEPAA